MAQGIGESVAGSYRSQSRQRGQVATAIPVPTDTISSTVTSREMRTRRIAKTAAPSRTPRAQQQ